MKATAKDMRFHTKELLDAVSRGEEVTITYRGKPRAKLVPLDVEDERDSDDDVFGMWADHMGEQSVDDYIRIKRKNRFQ